MKKRLNRVVFILLCATVMLTALGAAALAEATPCTHEYAKIERPSGDTYAATCVAPGGYIIKVTCSNCDAYLYEYKQADASAYPINPAAHQYTTNTVAGECAGATTTQKICTLCGHTETDTNSGNHSWVSKTHTASTCNEQSYTYQECSKCGMTRNHQSTSTVLTHTYTLNPVQTVREPSCGVAGEGTQKCDCGDKTRTVRLPATGNHTYGSTETKQGDCGVAGSKTVTSQTCKTCGYVNVISSVTPPHTFVASDVVAATCTSTGVRESRCSVCGYVNWSQPTSKASHTPGPWQTEGDRHWRNCTVCSAELNAGTHVANKKEPYCTDRVYCTVCYTDLRPAGKHSTAVASDSGDDTYHDMKCPDCGYVSTRVKHTYAYVGNDCTKGRICSVCGHQAGGNASHTLSTSWTGVSGGHARKCTVSGCSYTVSEAHTWGDWFVAFEPTTTSVGTEAARCTKCNATMTRAIPKLTATATPKLTTTATPKPTEAPADTVAPAQTSEPAVSGATPAPTASGAQDEAPATAAATTGMPSQQPDSTAPELNAEPTDAAPLASAEAFPAPPITTRAIGSVSCVEHDRDCAWAEFLQGGLLVRVCTLCGDVVAFPLFSDATAMEPVFQTLSGVTLTGTTPASGELILRAANLGTSGDAFVAISVAWEQDGESRPIDEAVRISLPLVIDGESIAPAADFRLVRVDVSGDEARIEEWTDIDFTYEDGALTFDLEQTGIYLLIPA